MSKVIYEEDLEVKALPGRDLMWYFTPEMGLSDAFSMNVVKIRPGCTVSPAHSHPDKVEVIYVVSGEGKAYIDGKVYPIHEGTSVLFGKGAVHMLRNSGDVMMKVACFFAPQATFDDYRYYEDVVFPEDKQ